jgi:regulator of RNase E activity RraB
MEMTVFITDIFLKTKNKTKIARGINIMNKYYEFFDGWFTYFVNVKTGEKKFELEDGDILVDCNGRIIND